MSYSTLTLLIDSLEPSGGSWPSMPALQQLLSKGERGPLAGDYYSVLCGLFGLAGDTATLPLAPLSALGDGLDSGEGWWLQADPVHLLADRDQLYLSAYQALHISQSEAERLVTELNRTYEEDGWRFHVPHPARWYLQLPTPLVVQTIPTSTAMGGRVGEVLPRGEDGLRWQRVMTEIQMVLHANPVNAERCAAGELAINSLWFWGGGALPVTEATPEWRQLLAEEPLALGLARLFAIPVGNAAAGGQTLQISTGRSAAEAEQALFAPALERLRRGELQRLELLLPGHGSWRIDRRALRRWWRRRLPLEKLLGVAQ